MQYWLFKSEPSAFSFEALKAKGKAGSQWDGVRNYAARNNMKAMQIGDLGFFYHSNEGLNVVGIADASGNIVQISLFESAMGPMIGASIVAIQHRLNPPLVTLLVGVGITASFLSLPLWWYLLQDV